MAQGVGTYGTPFVAALTQPPNVTRTPRSAEVTSTCFRPCGHPRLVKVPDFVGGESESLEELAQVGKVLPTSHATESNIPEH